MAGYFGNIPTPQATQTRDTFTATSGQTSFATSGYTVGMLDVYLNGIKLASADFTATNGSDVVLASGASADDIVEVVSFSTFDSASGAFSVDLKSDKLLNKSGDQDSGINLATNDTIKFDIAGSTKWTMNSSGNLFPAATTQGIVLGATSDTAANRLDDYEEGTWTGTIIGHSAAPSSSQTATGLYTKIGRLCTVSLYSGEKNTSGASGDLRITGLPFTSHSSSTNFGGYLSYNMANNAANTVNTVCWVAGSVDYVSFYDNLDAGAWSTTQIYAGTTYIAFSVTYPVA